MNFIFRLITGIILCAISYTQGYTDGCCESLERQTIEYIKRHAPKLYEDLTKEDKNEL